MCILQCRNDNLSGRKDVTINCYDILVSGNGISQRRKDITQRWNNILQNGNNISQSATISCREIKQ